MDGVWVTRVYTPLRTRSKGHRYGQLNSDVCEALWVQARCFALIVFLYFIAMQRLQRPKPSTCLGLDVPSRAVLWDSRDQLPAGRLSASKALFEPDWTLCAL